MPVNREGKAQMKLLIAVAVLFGATLVAPTTAQSQTTITWANAGAPSPGYPYCLNVTSEDGATVTGSYYYCPEQPTSFDSPDCPPFAYPQICYGSLYLSNDGTGQPLTLEGLTITVGTAVVTSRNTDGTVHTFTRTDTISADSEGTTPPTWTGSTTQNYLNVPVRRCNQFGCHTVLVARNVGGSGKITSVH